jgi:hypothetical protein
MAKRSAKGESPLLFRGLPHRLSLSNAALAGHECGEILLPDTLAVHSRCAAHSLPVRHGCAKDPSVRLRLDRTAPPGRYQAQLRLSGKSVPVELDIAPAPRLHAFPPSAEFVGKPGYDAVAEVTLTNKGNVAIELPERFVTGIFDDDGLETAFAETYRQDTDDPVELFGAWLRSLRSGYGGMLKLRIASGAGTLPPGAERTIALSAHLPECLKPGHFYHGIWKLRPMRYRFKVAAQR